MANVNLPIVFRRKRKDAKGNEYLTPTYYFRKAVDGKNRWINTKCTRKADAQAYLIDWLQKYQSTGDAPVKKEPVSFGKMKELLENHYNVNKLKSLKRAKEGMAHLDDYFKLHTAAMITTTEVEAYKAFRVAEKAAPATINRELGFMSKMFSLMVDQELVVKRPKINKLPENNIRNVYITEEEHRKIRMQLPTYLLHFVDVAFITGARFDEVASLKWKDLDFDRKIIRFVDTKNKEGREVPMMGDLEFWLKMWKKWQEADKLYGPNKYVFYGRKKTKITNIQKAWANALKEAKITDKKFHDYRRSAVKRMYDAGIPEKTIMQITGHKTRIMTDRYHVITEDAMKQAGDKVTQYMIDQKIIDEPNPKLEKLLVGDEK
jgi:integrase